MGGQEVDVSLHALKGFENAIPTVNQMIVDGYEHQGRVSDNAPIPGGEHGKIGGVVLKMEALQPLKSVLE